MKLRAESIFLVGILIVVVFGVVGLVLLSNKPAEKADTNSIVRDNNYFTGPKDAKVVLVGFADFQCPACKAIEPVVQKIQSEYKDKVKFVFKHFPLPSHNNGLDAALASEAAGEQGKFWEFHDVLFEKQGEWSGLSNPNSEFEKYAKDLGLDLEKFSKSLNDKIYLEKINTDKSDGIDLSVQATPTFFLNGEKLEGGLSYEQFKEKIEKILATN